MKLLRETKLQMVTVLSTNVVQCKKKKKETQECISFNNTIAFSIIFV